MYLKQVKNLMPYFLNENNNDIYVGFVPDNIYIYSTGTIYIYSYRTIYIFNLFLNKEWKKTIREIFYRNKFGFKKFTANFPQNVFKVFIREG